MGAVILSRWQTLPPVTSAAALDTSPTADNDSGLGGVLGGIGGTIGGMVSGVESTIASACWRRNTATATSAAPTTAITFYSRRNRGLAYAGHLDDRG